MYSSCCGVWCIRARVGTETTGLAGLVEVWTRNTTETVMDWEFAFKTLWGLATAAGWFWVNNISNRLNEAVRERMRLKDELHQVKLDYQTKAEATANGENIARSLIRIEDKLDKLAERKADKS